MRPITERQRAWVLVVGIATTILGAWAFFSPEGFFTDFPIEGARWVSTLGEFNDHLTRDYGSAQIGLGVAATLVALARSPSGVVAVMAGLVVFGTLHLGHHLTTFDSFTPASAASQALALALSIGVALQTPAGTEIQIVRANGEISIMGALGGFANGIIAFEISGDQVIGVRALLNPDKLATVEFDY